MHRLAAMEAFVLVVDTGSFSAAGRRLNVGQPTVSKLVAQLEERLGVKLLVRTTRGLKATEAGLNYYERARRSIEEADEAELAARGAAKPHWEASRRCGSHICPHSLDAALTGTP
jgi:DNA-binding transcriptional LysR family regulator